MLAGLLTASCESLRRCGTRNFLWADQQALSALVAPDTAKYERYLAKNDRQRIQRPETLRWKQKN
jgi:hypothetical protein